MNIDSSRIDQWMSTDPVVIDIATPLQRAIRKMRDCRIGAILVVDGRALVGIFTERDLLALVEELFDAEVLQKPVSKFMTKKPVTVNFDEPFNSVYMKMRVNNIRHLPVLDGAEIVGVVSLRDLAEFYEKRIESELEKNRSQIERLRHFLDLSKSCQGQKIIRELERLEELSMTDYLTGLYNTRYFSARLAEELERARRHKTRLSLIFCDIDFFKKVNDRYGHQFGDYILKKIGQILVSRVDNVKIVARLRKSDVVARYGGEEFVVILPETPKKNALEVAERMRQAVADYDFQFKGGSVSVTMSFGVAEYPEDSRDCENLIKQSDLAMYQAKKSGRNRVLGFSSDIDSAVDNCLRKSIAEV